MLRLIGAKLTSSKRLRSMVDGAWHAKNRNIAIYAVVSFLSTVLLEILLEGATRSPAGGSHSLIVALFLTLGEFLGCCIWSKVAGGNLIDRPSQRTDLNFWKPYVGMSALLLLGSGLPNLAVHWVQYPLKVTIKSSKLMLAMAVAAACGNDRQYSLSEYFVSFLLVVGNLSFSFGSGRTDAPTHLAVLGVVLLLAASLMDVLAVNAQQRMMQKDMVSPMSLMLRQNFIGLVGCSILALIVVASSDESLTNDWQQVLWCMFSVGLCTGMSAWANTHLVNEAGSVGQARISSFRKLATLILSYILFPKPFDRWRGVCIAVVVVSLGLLHSLNRRAKDTPKNALAANDQAKIVPLNNSQQPVQDNVDLEAATPLISSNILTLSNGQDKPKNAFALNHQVKIVPLNGTLPIKDVNLGSSAGQDRDIEEATSPLLSSSGPLPRCGSGGNDSEAATTSPDETCDGSSSSSDSQEDEKNDLGMSDVGKLP